MASILPYPETVSFYPLMGIEAARRASAVGGGWRAYVLGKALDAQGWGMVKRDDLQAYALELGVNLRTWQRWLNEARAHELLIDIQKGSDWYFILPAAGRAGLALGMDTIGGRKAIIPAADLVSKGWKARVFSAWEDGKQITRERIRDEIGVPLSTQRYRDSKAGTERTRNYCKSRMKADNLAGVEEHTKHAAPFVMRDGFIAWRLPDTRASTCAQRGSKGRARKANRFIRSANPQTGLSNMRQALSDGEDRADWIRLFNDTQDQRLDSENKLKKRQIKDRCSGIMELYQRTRRETRTGAVIWGHYPRF